MIRDLRTSVFDGKMLQGIIAALLLGCVMDVSGDDTEIYKSEYSGGATSGRPKVLIVFDDSGSMKDSVAGVRPAYDPDEDYEREVSSDRIYWSVDGEVPPEDSSQWFEDDRNRCEASYSNLAEDGRFGTDRARRWRDSEVIPGECTTQCAVGEYINPPGRQRTGCYTREDEYEPVPKWVYAGAPRVRRGRYRCDSDEELFSNNGVRGCYEEYEDDDAEAAGLAGWVLRGDANRGSCSAGSLFIRLDSRGREDEEEGCHELITGPEYVVTGFEYVSQGQPTQVCENETVVAGEWQALSASVNSPTHVDCRNDVNNSLTGNGGNGVPDGYPQSNVANGNEYAGTKDDGVDWGGDSYTFFTSHYMNWYYDESLSEERKKLDIAIEVVSEIIATNTDVDFGLMEFNWSQGGRITRRIIQNMSLEERENLVDIVGDLEHAGSTPLCESVYEAYNYLAGNDIEYGYDKSNNTSRFFGRDWGGDIQSRDRSAESGGKYISPNTDCAYTYIIVMTDGFPQSDTGANSRIENLTGKTCGEYTDAGGSQEKNCLPEIAEYMATTDLDSDPSNGDQFGITYTIGFQTDQQLLADAAALGGGEYFTANDARELSAAFQGTITGILSRDTSFTSPAVAVDTFTRTRTLNEVFYAMFKPGNRVDWIGNIKKLKVETSAGNTRLVDKNGAAAIDPATGAIKDTATTFWSLDEDGGAADEGGVGALLAARDPGSRSIFTNTGADGALQPFVASNITADAMGLAGNAQLFSLFGVSSESAFLRQISWARGFDAYDADGDSLTDEPREWVLGDILHSQPVVINYGALGSFDADDPDLRILVGTNAGFIHQFNNATGAEDWAFFPRELASIIPQRRRNELSSENIYGMDLTAVTYTLDVNNDKTLDASEGDKAWAFFGMRRGGSAYYALDLSNPDAPVFMWRLGSDSEGFSELGQTWSEPVVTTIPGYHDDAGRSRPVLIFGAGYDTAKDSTSVASPDSEGRGLFIVDAQTGALVWSVTGRTDVNSATHLYEPGLLHSVPGNVSVLDSNGDGLTDRVYFGDSGGNLWRVDLAGSTLPTSDQDSWRITQLADFNSGTVPTDRRFFNAPEIVRSRVAGQAIDAIIIGSGDRTNPNATDVNNRLYMFRDEAITIYDTERPSSSECASAEIVDFRCELPVSDGDLFNITGDPINTGTNTEQIDARNDLLAANGWKFDLQGSGEKSTAKTLTLNGRVFAPTFVPSDVFSDANVCEPQSGLGKLYVIDLYSGESGSIPLGPIIPDTPSIIVTREPNEAPEIKMLLPPGAPESEGVINCLGGVCDPQQTLRGPYGRYWYQEPHQ